MRVVIDLQSCQNGSADRGIGRYALAMSRAMIRNGRDRHTFRILLSDRFPERIARVRAAFTDLLEPHEIVVGAALHHVGSAIDENQWRARAGEVAWADFLESFAPDAYFTPSLFEGSWDDTITSVEASDYVRAATLYDLIPLEDPDGYLPGDGNKSAYARKVAYLKRCDHLFSISAHSKSEAIGHLGLEADRIVVTPLGVEPAFSPAKLKPERVQQLRRRYRLRDRFIITASPFETRKNINGLIAGLAGVPAAARKGVQLLIAGKMDAHARHVISSVAEREGLAPHEVLLPGFVPDQDLIDLYRICDAMVFPSLSEGFGLPPLEAMACGAAVLASNTTSLPEVVSRKDATFDPADIGDISRAIERVLTDDAFRAALRAYGPKRAARFSWDRSASLILETLEAAVLKRRSDAVKRETSPVATAVSQKPRSLAVVTTGGIPHSRESTLVREWIRVLSTSYDVSIFAFDADLGRDVTLPLETRSLDEFVSLGGAYDRALYILDSSRVDTALPVMAARPGALLLYDRLAPTDQRSVSLSQVADLRAQGGWRSVLEGMSGGTSWQPGAAAIKLAHGAAVEGDSPFAARVPTVTARVAGPAKGIERYFKMARGIPEDASDVWAAFVSDDEAAEAVLRAFRRQREATRRKAWLLLIPALSAMVEGPVEGRVFVMPNGFTHPYTEVMAAATGVFIDEALPAATRRRLEADAALFGLALLPADFEPPAKPRAKPKTSVATRLAEDRAFLDIVARLLDQAPPPRVVDAELARRMPPIAGHKRPEPDDLRHVATVLSQNMERHRPGALLIDVTSALNVPAAGLQGTVRRFLRGLLTADGDVRFVAYDGRTWFEAGSLVSALLAVPGPRDEMFWPAEADRLIQFDLLGGLGRPDDAPMAGVRLVQAEVSDLVHARPDLTEDVAAAVAEAVRMEIAGAGLVALGGPVRRRETDGGVTLAFGTSPGQPADPHTAPATARLAAALSTKPKALDARLNVGFTIQGHVLGTYSLAVVNRRMAAVLDAAYPGRVDYLPMETHPVSDLSGVPVEERELIQRLVKPAKRSKLHVTVSQHWPVQPPASRSGVGIGMVMWEESHLPGSMVSVLNSSFDGALMPVRTVQKALIDSGVHIPTVLTGLAADIEPYRDVCRREGPAKTFLHVSSCFPRKGVDVLLEAWGRAFTARDGVTLVIKTFPNPHNDVHDQVHALSRRYPEMAPIHILNRDMERDELVELYRDADVMVLPTRGEGYNLPALEAMAAGLPLITTGYGGHRDFAGPADARLIDFRFGLSGSHVRDAVSYWVEPSVEDLAEALREQVRPDAQHAIERRRRHAALSAAAAVDPQRWVAAVTDFSRSLVEPIDRSPVRTDWVTTWAIRCGIAEYSRFLIDHMDETWRDHLTIVADDRTDAEAELAPHRLGWGVGGHFDPQRLLQDIAATDAEAVVLQHQDGLIEWHHLATLLEDQRLLARTTVIELHVVRTMARLADEVRARVIAALGRADRVLVHSIDDLNLLKDYGLIDNVALFPHGAIKPDTAPPEVRALGPGSAPVIGCHGFFFRHKRVDAVIRACAELRARWPGLRLRLVNARYPDPSSDDAIAHARAVAEEVGMADAIDWHTDFLPVDEIRRLLAGCDLLVLPYDETGDSASGAVRVAMSAQVPTLTTPVKIFTDVEGAVAHVASNETAPLAAEIGRLLESRPERARIQGRIVDWLALHDWRRMAGNLEGMVKALAFARRRDRAAADAEAPAAAAE